MGTVTPLSLYAISANGVTLGTARQMTTNNSGAGTLALSSLIGNTATGFGQLYAQGNAAAWGSFSGIQAPNGQGFLLEQSLLNLTGFTIPGNTWNIRVRAKTSVGTLTADLWVPTYIYNALTTTYTALGTALSLTGQTIAVGAANFDLTPANLPSWTFGPNDFLYWEVWANVTANNTGNAAATFGVIEGNSATQGVPQNSFHVVTPGYTSGSLIIGAARRMSTRRRRAIW